MRAVRDLRRLQAAGLGRLARLYDTADHAVSSPVGSLERETEIAYVVVELYNCWHSLSRSLFISSAFRARDGSGKRIALTVPESTDVDAALTHGIAKTKPWTARKKQPPWSWSDEPSWARTGVLLDCLDAIGASNRPLVTAGLSVTTKVFGHLPTFRHFFAHRNLDTVRKLRQPIASYAIAPSLRPTDALATPASSPKGLRPQPLLLDWVDDVRNVVTLIV
jgi:hypothetical protein